MFNAIPKSPEEIDADWLNAALEAEGNPAAGSVTACDTRRLDTQGNTGWYALADIESDAASDLPETLFIKVATEYNVKVSSQYQNYATEIAFYRDIAPSADVRFLRMIYGAADEANDAGIVVLEAYDPS